MTIRRQEHKGVAVRVGVGVCSVVIAIAILVYWNIYQTIITKTLFSSYTPHTYEISHYHPTLYNNLPLWMQEYFRWHRQRLMDIETNITSLSSSLSSRSAAAENVWMQQRLIVMKCHGIDRCGGTADRFKALPLIVAVAAQCRRLLFIDWSRPYPLEAFMRPVEFNWTVPDDLKPLLLSMRNRTRITTSKRTKLQKSTYVRVEDLTNATQKPHLWLMESILQHAGGPLYMQISNQLQQSNDNTTLNSMRTLDPILDPTLDPTLLYHDIFHTFFGPSLELKVVLNNMMQALQLQPNQFVVAHYRALYPREPYRETGNMAVLEETALHAVTCAASLTPSPVPVYVASDTLLALQSIQKHYLQEPHDKKLRVVSYLDAKDEIGWEAQDPGHLNFAATASAQDLFPTFVDLFLMSYSQCVTYGAGGFGRLGSLISHNITCGKAFTVNGILKDC